jgi:hypothetical protein
VVRLSGAAGPPFCCVPDGDGDPVQIDGVVPGLVAGGWLGLHALISATEAASGTNAVAAATLRRVAGLTMGRAYPGDDAARNGPRRRAGSSTQPGDDAARNRPKPR